MSAHEDGKDGDMKDGDMKDGDRLDRDRLDGDRTPVTHEELCALVLGELGEEQRGRVERAVAADPALGAERARVEQTIGLVRGALGGGESLSPPAREALLEAARGPSGAPAGAPRAYRPMLRAAAGLLALIGGLVLARELADRRAHGPTPHGWGEELARGGPADQVRHALVALEAVAGDPLEAAGGNELLALSVEHVKRFGDSEPPAPAGEQRALTALGYTGGERTQPWPLDREIPTGTPHYTWRDSSSVNDAAGIGGGAGREYAGRRAAPQPQERGLTNQLVPGDPRARGEMPSSAQGGGMLMEAPSRVESSPPGRGRPAAPAAPGGPGQQSAIDLDGFGSTKGDPSFDPAGAPVPEALHGLGYIGSEEREELRARRQLEVLGKDLEALDAPASWSSVRGQREQRELSAAELDALVHERLGRLLADCRRRPSERPSAMFFRYWGDNPFVLAQLEAQSTFGVDVDTASYALARRYLREGHLPEKAQVRTEEFVNYFRPDVEAPLESTFAIHTDLAPSRFANPAGERWMLRVVLRGKEVAQEERQPLALVFVIDVSGSMNRGNRLELVKHGLRLLVSQLDARDSVAIVAYSTDARLILPVTSAARRAEIESSLHALRPSGNTNTEAGLLMGYDLASGTLDRERVTRVVLLSDGVANVGVTDPKVLSERVRSQREKGIYLNTIGVGMGNHNDAFLEQLANAGDGICNYIDDEAEARRALVENFTGAFQPIARDVKVQLELDPTRVRRWRQLGYENRAIANRDFRNDAVDGGEVGAGHQVVALYELELEQLDAEEPLGVVRLRWKQPTSGGRDPMEDEATEIERPLHASQATSWEGASAGYRRAVVVAGFAEVLRRSVHARDVSLDELIAEGAKLAAQSGDPELAELVSLMERSRQLVLSARAPYGELERCLDLYRLNCIRQAELEALGHPPQHAQIAELERQNAELRRLLLELLRAQLSAQGAPHRR